MQETFDEIGINEKLTAGLAKMGITVPTRIQQELIPQIIAGKDVIGQSATGTGKTLAYLLPLFQKIDTGRREMQVLVLAPTHELAMQIFRQTELLSQTSAVPVTAAVIIGDANITRQIDKLKEKPHIIVGSAGRVLELIQKRKINAHTVKTIVLDEADRLLDDNNRTSVSGIIKATQRDRQLLLVSATVTADAREKAGEWIKDPAIVEPQAEQEMPESMMHIYLRSESRDKIDVLRKLLASLKVTRALVFINTSEAIAATAAKLSHHDVVAMGLHGSGAKEERQAAMEAFRTGKARVLVASDLAARGLDITGVECVVNMELPEDPQIYLHRAGRTGRAGQAGLVISILERREEKYIAGLQKKLQIRLLPKHMERGKVLDDLD